MMLILANPVIARKRPAVPRQAPKTTHRILFSGCGGRAFRSICCLLGPAFADRRSFRFPAPKNDPLDRFLHGASSPLHPLLFKEQKYHPFGWYFFSLVAGEGLEPTTSGLSLRASLRFPKKSAGGSRRFPLPFSTAALALPRFFCHWQRSATRPNELRSSVS